MTKLCLAVAGLSAVVVVTVGACGGSTSGTPTGGVRQPCYANGTCNAGLTCASNVCVNLGDGGSGSSSGTGSSSGGMSSSSSGGTCQPPADAFVQASVGTGPMSNATMCPLGGVAAAWLNVGTATAGKPTTVQDGGNNGTGNVSVACKVTPSGNGFDIDLSVDQNGTQGSSMTISSPSGAGAVTASGGAGITATFTSVMDGGPYTSNACVITFDYMMAPVPVSPPVAGGRIWGHIDCPVAMLGGQPGKQCDARADFLFEQCCP